jgi:hypothetical protein
MIPTVETTANNIVKKIVRHNHFSPPCGGFFNFIFGILIFWGYARGFFQSFYKMNMNILLGDQNLYS